MTTATLANQMRAQLGTALLAAHALDPSANGLDADVSQACVDLVMNGKETARMVALTNVAGIAVDPAIEPDILQVQHGGVDFRSLYKRTTRPVLLDMATAAEVKWSPSADPYVSNPFREERVSDDWVLRRNNKLAGAHELNVILRAVKVDPGTANAVLTWLLYQELARLQSQKIEYRIPPRLTVQAVSQVLTEWLDGGAGGKRLETASVAILRHVGVKLGGIWDKVTSHHVNDPTPYDALCMSGQHVHTIAEVKDQSVTKHFVENLADQMVEHGAQRGLLLTRNKWLPEGDEKKRIDEYLKERNLLGLRIQVLDFDQALVAWLPLIDADDNALPSFLRRLTNELDKHGELADRTGLAAILRDI
ncbi:MAG: restriction endonuclease, SacI family [Devosia marina]|uniref:restriction endonuclease, SacI family n=1 Tax=Devosia marina TaxID=2683198 RepID=UPI0032EDDB3B